MMINTESLSKNNGGFQFDDTFFISSNEVYTDEYISIKAIINFKKPDPGIIRIGIHINKEYVLEVNNSLISVQACSESSENIAFKTLWSKSHDFNDQSTICLFVTRGADEKHKNRLSFAYSNSLDGEKQDIDYKVFCKKPIQYGLFGTKGASFQSIQLFKKQPVDYELEGRVDIINNGFEIQKGLVRYRRNLEAGVYSFSCSYTIMPQFTVTVPNPEENFKEFLADNIYHSSFVLTDATEVVIEMLSDVSTTIFNLALVQLSPDFNDGIPLSPTITNQINTNNNIQYTVSDINLDNGVGVGFDVIYCDEDFYGSQTILQMGESLQINFVNKRSSIDPAIYGSDYYYDGGNERVALYGDGELRYFLCQVKNSANLTYAAKIKVDPSNPIFKANWVNKILFDIHHDEINVFTTSTAFLRLQTPIESNNMWLYPISQDELNNIGIPLTGSMQVNNTEVQYELVQDSKTMYLSTQVEFNGHYALFNNRVVSQLYKTSIETPVSKQENVALFSSPIANYLIDNIIILNNENNFLDYQNFDPATTYYKHYTTFEDINPFNRVSLHLSDLNPLYPIECSEDGLHVYQQVFSALDDNLVQQKVIEYSQDKIAIGDWYNISILTSQQEKISYVRYDNDYIYLTNHNLIVGDKVIIRYIANKTFATNTKNGKTYLTIVNPTESLSIKYTSSLKEEDYVHHINLNPFASDTNSGFIYLTEQNNVRQLDVRFNKNTIKLDNEDLVIVTVKCLGDNNSTANNFNIECQCNHPSLVLSKYTSDEEENVVKLFNRAFVEYGEDYAKNLYNLLISDKYQSGQEIFLLQGRSTTTEDVSKEAELVFTDTITGIKSTLKLQVTNGQDGEKRAIL